MIVKPKNVKLGKTFSVLLPIYQRDDLEERFCEVLKSCYAGVVQPEVVIVVVDGPLKASFNLIIEQVGAKYSIKIIRSDERIGLSAALNLGLSAVKTDFVFRVDGDDLSRPERWALQLAKLQEGFVLVGGQIQEVNKYGSPIAKRRVPLENDDIKRFAKRRNPFNHMSIAFQTDIIKHLGGYPHIFLKEDWALWVKCISSGHPCANIDVVLVDALAGDDMYRRRGGLKNVLSEWSMQILLIKNLNKNMFLALFDFSIKTLILFCPMSLRKIIYENILRSQ
jgi:glycosyltransferase involved in cell wall biosynthesis